jgi:hypothetical protein
MGLRFWYYTLAACPVTSTGLGEDGTSSSVVSAYSSHLQLQPHIPFSRETVLLAKSNSSPSLSYCINVISSLCKMQKTRRDKTNNLAREISF